MLFMPFMVKKGEEVIREIRVNQVQKNSRARSR